MADEDPDIPGLPEDPPPPEPPKNRPPKRSIWWMLGRPPLFLSYWFLVVFAWCGVFWLTSSLLGGVVGVLWATIITAVVAGVLRDSFLEDPPHRF